MKAIIIVFQNNIQFMSSNIFAIYAFDVLILLKGKTINNILLGVQRVEHFIFDSSVFVFNLAICERLFQ